MTKPKEISIKMIRHDATTSTQCLKNDKDIQNQTDIAKPIEPRKKKDFSRSNWLRDDISFASSSNETSDEESDWRVESRKSRISEYKAGKPLILNNKFCGLLCQEPIAAEEELSVDNENIGRQPQEIQRNDIPPHTKRRPDVVAPKAPEKGHAFSKSISPGNSTYANTVKHGKAICLVGDSIIGRIRVPKFKTSMRNLGITANFRKRFYPRSTAGEIAHYILPTLEEERPDALIINAGTNNLQKRDYDAPTVFQAIMKIAKTANENGVGQIFISSITARHDQRLQNRANEVNSILKELCSSNSTIFIDNGDINNEHVCNDGVHLSENGLEILATNFLTSMMHFLR